MEQEGDEGRDGERPECLERCPFLAWQKKLGPMISELWDAFDAYIREAEERERAVMVGPDQSALLAAAVTQAKADVAEGRETLEPWSVTVQD